MSLLSLTLTLTVAGRTASACATCGCGDPTLTAVGIDKPYANRVRIGLEERFGGTTAGNPSDPDQFEQTWVLRSSLVATWAPTPRVTIMGTLPVLAIWTYVAPQSPWASSVGLGDAELAARAIVWRDRAWSPQHMVSLLGGLKLPTGPRISDSTGATLAPDDQPGSGSWDPFAGLGYAWFGPTWSAFSSVAYRYTTPGRDGYRRGQSVGATAGVQLQPWGRVAFSLAGDFRWSAADQSQTPTGPVDVPNNGGAMLALTPALLIAPVSDWIIRVAYQIHLGEWLNGIQSEASAIFVSTVVDLN